MLMKNEESFKPEDIMNFDKIKEHLYFRVINQNADAIGSADKPCRKFLDLIFYYSIKIPGICADFICNNTHLKMWNITEEDLYETVLANGKREDYFYCEYVPDMLQELELTTDMNLGANDNNEFDMHAVSSLDLDHGAGVIFIPTVAEELARAMGTKKLMILPSSVNETLAVPCEYKSAEELLSIVTDVNSFAVLPEEKLADSVYCYDVVSKEYSVAAHQIILGNRKEI